MALPKLSDLLGPPTPRGRKVCYVSGLALSAWLPFAAVIAAHQGLWITLGIEIVCLILLMAQLQVMKNYYNSNGGKW